MHYLYDALDRRVRKVMTNPAGTTVTLDERYLYQPDGALATVFNQQLGGTAPRQVAVARYASAVDRVLAEEAISGGAAQTPLFFLHDHLGTTRDALQRDSGGVVQLERQYRYDEFGRHIGSYDFNGSTYVATAAPRIGFTGQQYDVETDFNYYQARYYSPRMGRFLSRDPAGFSTGDLNLYRYVGNDPVSLIDPTGMNPFRPTQWGGSAPSIYAPMHTVPTSALQFSSPRAPESRMESMGLENWSPFSQPSLSEVVAMANITGESLIDYDSGISGIGHRDLAAREQAIMDRRRVIYEGLGGNNPTGQTVMTFAWSREPAPFSLEWYYFRQAAGINASAGSPRAKALERSAIAAYAEAEARRQIDYPQAEGPFGRLMADADIRREAYESERAMG